MKEDFDIFQEKDIDKEFCPKMECTDNKEEIYDLVDWAGLEEAEDVNDNGEAMIVLGYFKQASEHSYVKFHRCFTISSKTKQKVRLQHHKKEGYDLLLCFADTDAEGKELEDPDDKCVVAIKVKGPVSETMKPSENAPVEQRRMYKELVQDMSVPMNNKLRVFVAGFYKKPKKKKAKEEEREAASQDSTASRGD